MSSEIEDLDQLFEYGSEKTTSSVWGIYITILYGRKVDWRLEAISKDSVKIDVFWDWCNM